MWIRKCLSIILFILHYLTALLGKILAYIVTPFIFPFRHSIRSYAYNFFMKQGVFLERNTIYKQDLDTYYTKHGYIVKRPTNRIVGYLSIFLWFWLDDDADLDCCSRAFVKPSEVDGLEVEGSYFDLGDMQRTNKLKLTWRNFKNFYYWTVIRNGFYNWNYLIEDSILDRTSGIDLPPHKRIHESNPNIKPFKYNEFYQDTNGKWFFYLARCWVNSKGEASGFDLGYRRIQPNKDNTNSSGVNAVIRLYWKKKW